MCHYKQNPDADLVCSDLFNFNQSHHLATIQNIFVFCSRHLRPSGSLKQLICKVNIFWCTDMNRTGHCNCRTVWLHLTRFHICYTTQTHRGHMLCFGCLFRIIGIKYNDSNQITHSKCCCELPRRNRAHSQHRFTHLQTSEVKTKNYTESVI